MRNWKRRENLLNGLKIGRTPLFAAVLFLSLLLGQMILEVQSTITPKTVVTEMRVDEDIWVQSKSLRIQANYTIRRIDTIQYGMQFTHLYANGRITVNGERLPFEFKTERYPTYKIYAATAGLSSSPVRYTWDGITFISADSTPYHVEYDHVDNGPYSPPTYDIPPNEADPTTLKGCAKYHHHIPQWTIKDMATSGTLTALAGAVGTVIVALLKIPDVTSKVIASFLLVIPAVLAILGLLIKVFVEAILQTELDDGWTWLWGLESRSILGWTFFWWRESFGRWRDWGWSFWYVIPSFTAARFEAGVRHMTMTICAW
jgi:hypothetical protein